MIICQYLALSGNYSSCCSLFPPLAEQSSEVQEPHQHLGTREHDAAQSSQEDRVSGRLLNCIAVVFLCVVVWVGYFFVCVFPIGVGGFVGIFFLFCFVLGWVFCCCFFPIGVLFCVGGGGVFCFFGLVNPLELSSSNRALFSFVCVQPLPCVCIYIYAVSSAIQAALHSVFRGTCLQLGQKQALEI